MPPMTTKRMRLARRAVRTYPFSRGRAGLGALIAAGRRTQIDQEFRREAAAALPEGEVIECRHGMRIRVRRERTYVNPYLLGAYEPRMSGALGSLARPGDVVFDVGTNFGWFAALFGRTVGPDGRVHAFEPVPTLAELAHDTIVVNGVEDRVRLNVRGLGAEEGEFVVYTFAGLPQGHASATDLGRDDAEPHTCAVTTLDAYVRQEDVERIDLLKLDVEGHEPDVIDGAATTLAGDDAPVVTFETNIACLADRGIPADTARARLSDLGYSSFWRIEPEGASPVEPGLPEEDADYVAAKPARAAFVAEALGV